MLIAAVIVVSFTASFLSRTNTQTTKLQEENQKALAAAEAGIQAALKSNNSVSISSISGLTNYTGSATLAASSASPTFSTSAIQTSDQYTFYLTAYSPATKTFSGSSNNTQDITICFGNKSSSTLPALEITVLKSDGTMTRSIVDPSSRIANATSGNAGCTANTETFTRSTTITGATIGINARVMIVRVLYTPSSLFFSSSTNLPVQGTSVDSTATSSQTGVTKKLRVFQSYPQIPAEMFNVRF